MSAVTIKPKTLSADKTPHIFRVQTVMQTKADTVAQQLCHTIYTGINVLRHDHQRVIVSYRIIAIFTAIFF